MNPTSYQPGARFTGKQLNDWCKDQVDNHRSHEKIAKKLWLHFVFKDNRVYELTYMRYRESDDFGTVGFIRVT